MSNTGKCIRALGLLILAALSLILTAASENHAGPTNRAAETTPPTLQLEADAAEASAFAPEVAVLMGVPFSGGCHGCRECNEDPPRHETWEDSDGDWTVDSQAHDEIHKCSGSYSLYACKDAHSQDCSLSLALGSVSGEGGEVVALHDLLNLMVASGPAGLDSFVQEHPGFLRINQARQALQVYGCSGDLIAHLPLSPESVLSVRRGD